MTVGEEENTAEGWEAHTHTHTHTLFHMQNMHTHTQTGAQAHFRFSFLRYKGSNIHTNTHTHAGHKRRASLSLLPPESPWSCDDGDGEQCVLTVTVTQSCIQHKNLRGKKALCFKNATGLQSAAPAHEILWSEHKLWGAAFTLWTGTRRRLNMPIRLHDRQQQKLDLAVLWIYHEMCAVQVKR